MKPYYEHAGITIYHGLLTMSGNMASLTKMLKVGKCIVSHIPIFVVAVRGSIPTPFTKAEDGDQSTSPFAQRLGIGIFPRPVMMLWAKALSLFNMFRFLSVSHLGAGLNTGNIFSALPCSVTSCSFICVHSNSLPRMVML